MLLTFQGYFERGRFISEEAVPVPEQKKAIVTILGEDARKSGENREAWQDFFEAIESSDEEIPDEFPR